MYDLKTEQEKLKVDYELQKAMVKMKIFEEADKLEARPDQDPLLSKLPKYDNFTKDYVENLKTVKDDVIGQDDSSYKTDMISMFRRSRAPRIELDVFSGNPIDYPYFITSFGQVVETNVHIREGGYLYLSNIHRVKQRS